MNGLYNTEVDIYTKSSSSDFSATETWTFVASTYGRKSKLSGREVVRNEGNTIVADYIVYIDPRDDFDEEDRIVISETAYEIYDIDDPDDIGHHIEILVKKLNSSDYDGMNI